MLDDRGRVLSKAVPSTAIEVVGWRDLPFAGDIVQQVDSEVSVIFS